MPQTEMSFFMNKLRSTDDTGIALSYIQIERNKYQSLENKFMVDVLNFPGFMTMPPPYSIDLIEARVRSISRKLEAFFPDSMIINPTSDNSILFAFKKQEFDFYLEYFIDFQEIDSDECMVSSFKSKVSEFDFCGTLDAAFVMCGNLINQYKNLDNQHASFDANYLSKRITSLSYV